MYGRKWASIFYISSSFVNSTHTHTHKKIHQISWSWVLGNWLCCGKGTDLEGNHIQIVIHSCGYWLIESRITYLIWWFVSSGYSGCERTIYIWQAGAVYHVTSMHTHNLFRHIRILYSALYANRFRTERERKFGPFVVCRAHWPRFYVTDSINDCHLWHNFPAGARNNQRHQQSEKIPTYVRSLSQSIHICVLMQCVCVSCAQPLASNPMPLARNANGSRWLRNDDYWNRIKMPWQESISCWWYRDASLLPCALHACMHKSNEKFNHNNKWNVCGWADAHSELAQSDL